MRGRRGSRFLPLKQRVAEYLVETWLDLLGGWKCSAWIGKFIFATKGGSEGEKGWQVCQVRGDVRRRAGCGLRGWVVGEGRLRAAYVYHQ